MSPTRRNIALGAGAAIAALTLLPNRPSLSTRHMRIIVPASAGSMGDLVVRSVRPAMAAFLGERIVVENRRGAGAAVLPALPGAGFAPALLLRSGASLAQRFAATGEGGTGAEPVPVGVVAEAPLVLAVAAATGISDLDGYLEMVRMADRPPLLGALATDSIGHVLGLLLAREAGGAVEHMPYAGSMELLQDLAAGRLSAALIAANPAVILASAGRIRAVGVTGKRRYAALPDVPTIAEAGLDAAGMANWYALFARADTPSYTRRDIEAAIRHALDDAMVRRQMLALGAQPLLMDATRFARHLQAQRRVLEAVMAQGGRGPA